MHVEVMTSDTADCRVRIVGEIDMATIGALRAAFVEVLETSTPERLVVDIAGVTFLSAAGVRLFVQVGNRVRGSGSVFAVDPVSPIADRVIQACGCSDLVGAG
jgi:stage II sporulation protein AA (anti-sigma F factor antagonist)